MDADAPSYLLHSVVSVLKTAEEKKKWKYVTAAEAHRGSFSPFVVTVDSGLGLVHVAALFLCPLAEKLSTGWGKSYGEVLGWIKARLSFLSSGLLIYIWGDHMCIGDLAQILMMEQDSLLLCLCSISNLLILYFNLLTGLQMTMMVKISNLMWSHKK